jgi:hypothetical protein
MTVKWWMMNNVIFGSGVVGLLAKAILGPSWKVVPFYRSRFFTFNPALDDNFIISDPQTDEFIKDITGSIAVETLIYRRAWSVSGQIIPMWDSDLCVSWLNKIFGGQVPPQSEIYYKNRMNLPIYNLRTNVLYQSLMSMYVDDLKVEAAKGPVSEVGDHYFVRNGVREDFDNLLSTIPLNVLQKLMNVTAPPLQSKTLHYYHIQTDKLDFEGFNQQLVVDPIFDFYRATIIAPGRYLIYCHNEINNPGIYFMPIMQSFEILDGTSVPEALPMGVAPKLDFYESKDIYCVGSSAQWDWCMDVGSCILRTQRYAQRGFKPFKRKPIA